VEGELLLSVGLDGESALVERAVVIAAQQDQVIQIGSAALRPEHDVMGMEEPGPPAAWHSTAPIALPQNQKLTAADCPSGPAEIECPTVPSEDRRAQSAVVGEPSQRGPGQRRTAVEARSSEPGTATCLTVSRARFRGWPRCRG
jgi:hypothetical protein